jgi:hypothetical protein
VKFAVDLSKGVLGSADSTELWTEIISNIPDSVLLTPNVRILSVACGHCTEAFIIAKRMLALGLSKESVRDSIYLIDKYHQFTNPARATYGFTNVVTADFLQWTTDLSFDVILGNPPYQDGSKLGGQNKIYNQFSKKAYSLLTATGILAFITPASVLKKSKRFSLVGIEGLKQVNFTANDYFLNIGVNVCSWVVDKSYTGDVSVISQQGQTSVASNRSIYNPSEFDLEFIKIYEALKQIAATPKDRMYKQNPVDASINGRRKTPTAIHKYPVYKIGSTGEELVQYNKPVPKLHGKLKFVVSTTKSFQANTCVVSSNDFDVNHVFIDVASQAEVDNIKSFLFSEYFINHSNNFKRLDGYGFNNSLSYLPLFDKTKPWTNDEVKDFIEGICLNNPEKDLT